MAQLDEIPGIGAASRALLEAAGIPDAEHLVRQHPDNLVAELKKANAILGLCKRAPGRATVEKWIANAVSIVGEAPPVSGNAEPVAETLEPEQQLAVNYEASEEVARMLAAAPCAIPFPGKKMMEKQLRVGDIPAGLLLNRYSGDLDVRIGDRETARTDVPSRRVSGNAEQVTTEARQRKFDGSQLRTITTEAGTGKIRIPKSREGADEDRVALIRAPRESTNRGKDPNSRRYVRGVLHTHPWHLRLGAFFSLLLLVNLPLAVVSAFLLLLSRENPESFSWVPAWSLAFPAALPVTGLAYLIWGFSGKCRICTQKIFVHKAALKHVKAHHVPGFGYVVPLCLHLLAFSWFRCSSCGTPVRLKK